MTDAERQALADEIEAKLGPLTEETRYKGGYDCCGCSTYRQIVEDAKRIVLGQEPVGGTFD